MNNKRWTKPHSMEAVLKLNSSHQELQRPQMGALGKTAKIKVVKQRVGYGSTTLWCKLENLAWITVSILNSQLDLFRIRLPKIKQSLLLLTTSVWTTVLQTTLKMLGKRLKWTPYAKMERCYSEFSKFKFQLPQLTQVFSFKIKKILRISQITLHRNSIKSTFQPNCSTSYAYSPKLKKTKTSHVSLPEATKLQASINHLMTLQ